MILTFTTHHTGFFTERPSVIKYRRNKQNEHGPLPPCLVIILTTIALSLIAQLTSYIHVYLQVSTPPTLLEWNFKIGNTIY